ISIQENIVDLSNELSNKYVVSFLSRNLVADEFLKEFNEAENLVNIDDISTELEQTVISERSKKKSIRGKGQNKDEKNSLSSKKKAAIFAQLLKPPSFNILVHNMPYYKGYLILLKIYSGYRACGIVRTNSSMFSKILKFEKSVYLDWNILSGVVVNDILVMLWVDNSPVYMLSTIHSIK
ncbi:5878_t:CDS:2, partial [Racocetra persica]